MPPPEEFEGGQEVTAEAKAKVEAQVVKVEVELIAKEVQDVPKFKLVVWLIVLLQQVAVEEEGEVVAAAVVPAVLLGGPRGLVVEMKGKEHKLQRQQQPI